MSRQAFLPVSGVRRGEPGREPPAVSPRHRVPGADLPTLLSRALMSFRAEFEHDSALSLPVSANMLRVLSAGGVALRDVPRRAGVSREAVSLCAGLLEREGYAVTGPGPAGGRGRHVGLTPRGEQAQAAYHRVAGSIADAWRAQFGDGVIDGLAGALRALYTMPDGGPAPRRRVPGRRPGAPPEGAPDGGPGAPPEDAPDGGPGARRRASRSARSARAPQRMGTTGRR